MKRSKTMILLVCCCAALCCQTAMADCGKIWIYPYDWQYWPQGGQQVDQQSQVNPGDYLQSGSQSGSQAQGGSSTVNVNVGQLQENYNTLLQKVTELTTLIAKLEQKLEASNSKIGDGSQSDVRDNPGSSQADRDSGNRHDGYNEPQQDENGGYVQFGYFNEPEQQAVISWNGKNDQNGRETIILTTNEEIAYRGQKGYLLSVLPLPGKPESVKPANQKAFLLAKGLFFSKTPKPAQSDVDFAVVLREKIGAHNIFVWELDSVDTFQRDVQAWVAKEFGGNAAAYIDNETMNVLQYYIKSGFKYFAFDLTEVGSLSTKAAIAYTFQSSAVYYPLVVSRIGGTDDYSTVDLIIITPGSISPHQDSAIKRVVSEDAPALAKDTATLVRNGTVNFTIDEVRGIDAHLDVFDRGTTELTVRNIKFRKRLNSYTQDFLMK